MLILLVLRAQNYCSMKCMVWNCRGLGRPDFNSSFNFLCTLIKLDLFCLFETKMSLDKVQSNFYNRHFDQVFAIIPLAELVGFVCSRTHLPLILLF